MSDVATISQDAGVVHIEWIRGDPISLAFTVENVNWSGAYTAQVRRSQDPTSDLLGTLTVVATFSSPNTGFVLSMSAANSLLIPAGVWAWDLQATGSVTRLRGRAIVVEQVTA